jgi:hypothetical protein
MESFEVIIKDETYRINRDSPANYTFGVFNYATFHIINRNNFGIWQVIEHRFGTDTFPLDEIGAAIEKYYNDFQMGAGDLPSALSA